MRPTTEVSLALRHVGNSQESIHCWTGTFAHCIMEFARYCGSTSMATRFDLVMARSETEARAALAKSRSRGEVPELNMDNLMRLMGGDDSPTSAATTEVDLIPESGQ